MNRQIGRKVDRQTDSRKEELDKFRTARLYLSITAGQQIRQIDRQIVRQINKQGGEGVQDCHIYRQLDRQFVMFIYVDWDISHRKITRNALGLKEAQLITCSQDLQIKVVLLQGQLSTIVGILEHQDLLLRSGSTLI